jgi:cellulose synthase/poly-beta-1,6-N-acetylglucosamine synthase-like glycosyltransferase
MRLAFAISIGLILYTYLLYPVVLLVLGGVKQVGTDLKFGLRRRNRRARGTADPPLISLIFAAHNEAGVIAQKMLNCKEIDYPVDRLEILFGCDGCTDATASIARAAGLPHASVYEFGERGGKAAVLNRLVPMARGEILILCDANTLFEPETVRSLVRHFARPEVGCVCGELRLRTLGKPSSEALYWRYETLLKFLESRLNMLVGANGGVMAIRKALFVQIPPDGIVEDFLIAMNVRAAGHHVVYDPEAIAWEEVAPSVRQEFRRRVRIGAGNFHALRYTWKMLNPAAGSIALSFWSHKVCRWLVPIALCTAQLTAVALAGDSWYAACAALLAALSLLGFAGYRLDLRGRYWKPVSVPYYFLSMNLALLLGLFEFLRGTEFVVWRPTARQLVTVGGESAAGATVRLPAGATVRLPTGTTARLPAGAHGDASSDSVSSGAAGAL